MFRAVCSVLILATGFPVFTAASEAGKVRHIVALLQDVSHKLAIEREKENLVYGEIKRYCHGRADVDGDAASDNVTDSGADDDTGSDAASESPGSGFVKESSGDDDDVEVASDESSDVALDEDDDEDMDDDSIEGVDNATDTAVASVDTKLHVKQAIHSQSPRTPTTHARGQLQQKQAPHTSKMEIKPHPQVHITATKAVETPHQKKEKRDPQVQQSITKFTPKMVDSEDPQQELEQMNQFLAAAGAAKRMSSPSKAVQVGNPALDAKKQQVASDKAEAVKVVAKPPPHRKSLLAAKPIPKASPKQYEIQTNLGRLQLPALPSVAKPLISVGGSVHKAAKASPRPSAHHESHHVAKVAHERPRHMNSKAIGKLVEKQHEPVSVDNRTPLRQLEHGDSTSDESLADVVKAAVETESQSMTSVGAILPVAKPVVKQLEQNPVPVHIKTPLRQLEHVDSTAVESLADVVKAAVDTDDQGMMSANGVQPEPSAQPSKKLDAAVANVEPLASAVLSIDDTAVDDADGGPTLVVVPQKRIPSKVVATKSKPVAAVDPKVAAVQSEYAETAEQVARFEEDLMPPAPVPESPAATLRRLDPSIFAAAAAQAQQKESNDINAAAVSEAFSDLGGTIPNIDQEALQLYNSFGGEHASLESVDSGLPSPPTFLQATKSHQHRVAKSTKRHQHRMALAPAAKADLDAAFHALKDVAKDTESALSMMDLLRHGEADDQCSLLMKKFEHRRLVRAKREAELEERSQELQVALHPSHTGKTKHLRSQH